MAPIKNSGTFKGKSNALGHGGRAAQLASALKRQNPNMPKKEIGAILGIAARKAQAAPGQKNFHGKRR